MAVSSDKIDLLGMVNQMPVSSLVGITLLALVPLIFLASTSYLKVSVVMAVLRSALGGGQIPSQAISGILSLLITLFTIQPVIELILNRYSTSAKLEIIPKVLYLTEPLKESVKLNVQSRERTFFYNLENRRKKVNRKADCSNTDKNLELCLNENESVSSLILAFVTGELRIACLIGVYLFIPFLIIDLVVSTLLTGLGMMMVSPVTITLPAKLLLFILSDGWRLLIENLIIGYKIPGV